MVILFRHSILMLICLVVAAPVVRSAAITYLTEEQARGIAFPEADSFSEEIFLLNGEQIAAVSKETGKVVSNKIFKYTIAASGGSPLGSLVVDTVKSRSEEFTYMMAVSVSQEIILVEILDYESTRGARIRQPRFLGQFKGRTPGDFDDERIRHVSGATLSSRALIQNIRFQLAVLDIVFSSDQAAVVKRDLPAPPPDNSGLKLAGKGPEGECFHRRNRYLMGTYLEISLFAPCRMEVGEAFNEAFGEAGRLDGVLSVYHGNSEISQLNRNSGDWVEVSPEVMNLIQSALALGRRTEGGFDITVGPLVELWNDAVAKDRKPTAAEVRRVLKLTGPGSLEIDREMSRVRLVEKGSSINLGGIGKGYAIDRISEILSRWGLNSVLVNFGGNIRALGPPPGKRGWVIAVADPDDPGLSLDAILLEKGAISTSADYERGLRIGDEVFSHIIDPSRGHPAEEMSNVTVIAPTACEADSLSTGLYTLGLEKAKALAEESGLTVMAVGGSREFYRSKSYSKYLVP